MIVEKDVSFIQNTGQRKKVVTYEEEEESSHFMIYFLTAAVLCICLYVVYHNKQKVSCRLPDFIYANNIKVS